MPLPRSCWAAKVRGYRAKRATAKGVVAVVAVAVSVMSLQQPWRMLLPLLSLRQRR